MHIPYHRSFSNMFVWILFWGFLVHGISFANADALSNENINLFDDTDSLDPTYSNLISDNNLNIPDMFFNDEDDVNSANSFVSDNDIGINNSLDSTLLAAGCSSISTTDDEANLYSGARRKSRIRRGQETTACPNPAAGPNPKLSLPTLDQIGSSGNKNPPPEPSDNNPMKNMAIEGLTVKNGLIIKIFDDYYGRCLSEKWSCSSGDENDMSLDADGFHWTLRNSVPSKWFFFSLSSSLLYPRMSSFCVRCRILCLSLVSSTSSTSSTHLN